MVARGIWDAAERFESDILYQISCKFNLIDLNQIVLKFYKNMC